VRTVTGADTIWWIAAEGLDVGDKSSWWDFNMELVTSTSYRPPRRSPLPSVLILKGTQLTEISAPDRHQLQSL
jgi:hypothetical protein